MNQTQKHVEIGNVTIGNDQPLTVIAGPCQLENLDHALMIGETVARACEKSGAGYIFKASYDKANRTSLGGRRGVGIEEGLRMLEEVRKQLGCPVLTDVHDIDQARAAGAVVDVLQIPAFLSRQTDLLRHIGHVPRRQKLTFLDVHHRAGFPGGQKKIGLTA